ncbi:MAG: inositol monophosphatase family protein [Fimbriimonadaceae bacterium]
MANTKTITEATIPLIQQAATIAHQLRQELQIDQKKDSSLVTNVDRAIEQFLKPELLALTPGAGFYGEEFGHTPPTDAGYWVVDPVDGTSNFAYGQPLWGITAAYLKDGKIITGIILLPDLNELYTATVGEGAFLNGNPLPQIPEGDITDSQLLGNTDSRVQYLPLTPGKLRHIGSFVVESTFVATQRYRALITGNICLYDCAAGILINRELGAEIRYLTGETFNEANHLTTTQIPPFYIGPKNSNFPFDGLHQ